MKKYIFFTFIFITLITKTTYSQFVVDSLYPTFIPSNCTTSFNSGYINFNNFSFNQNIIIEDFCFASYPLSSFWNNGCSSSQSGCNNCYNYTNLITTTCPQVNSNIKLTFKVYRVNDNSINKPVLLFVQGGGFLPTAGSHVKNISSTNDLLYRYYATLGYVVVIMDYRKGWDWTSVQLRGYYPDNINTDPTSLENGCPINPNGAIANYPQAGICSGQSQFKLLGLPVYKSYTFPMAIYRMVQDIRAAHRKILNIKDYLKIDPNKIFYYGISTGAIGVLHAAYASDDLPNFKEYPNNSSSIKLSDANVCGAIDAFGDPTPGGVPFKVAGVFSIAGAILDKNWIESSDDVKICVLIYGNSDQVVNPNRGSLMNLTFIAGETNQSARNERHLNLDGSNLIYERLKEIWISPRYYLNFVLENVQHEGYIAPCNTNAMKCFYTTNNICMPITQSQREQVFNQNDVFLNYLHTIAVPLIHTTRWFNKTNTSGTVGGYEYLTFGNATQNCTFCNLSKISCNSNSNMRINIKDDIKIQDRKIFLYPNPVDKILNISINQEFENLFISSLDGVIVYNTNTNTKTIDISNFANGTYIIQALNHNGIIFEDKFIVVHE